VVVRIPSPVVPVHIACPENLMVGGIVKHIVVMDIGVMVIARLNMPLWVYVVIVISAVVAFLRELIFLHVGPVLRSTVIRSGIIPVADTCGPGVGRSAGSCCFTVPGGGIPMRPFGIHPGLRGLGSLLPLWLYGGLSGLGCFPGTRLFSLGLSDFRPLYSCTFTLIAGLGV